MTNNLYDIDASALRVEHAERAVSDQRIYIANQTDPAAVSQGKINLATLQDCLDIRRKNHFIINEVVMMRLAARTSFKVRR